MQIHSGYLPLHMQVMRIQWYKQWYKQYLLVRGRFCLLYASYYSPHVRICVWPHAYRCVWVKAGFLGFFCMEVVLQSLKHCLLVDYTCTYYLILDHVMLKPGSLIQES